MAPFSAYLHLIQTRVLADWAHFTPQNAQGKFSSSSKTSFSSTSELKSSAKNPAPFRHILFVSLVWIFISFHFESSFLRSVLSIFLSSQETSCCCLLRRVCVLRMYCTDTESFRILRKRDGEVIRKLLHITGIPDNPAVCRNSMSGSVKSPFNAVFFDTTGV